MALLIAIAVVTSACEPWRTPVGQGEAPSGAAVAASGGTFRFGQSGDATVLDPWNVAHGDSLLVTRQIYESLVDYEPTGFKVLPKLATKWEPSADGKTWTFTLRDGVRFHDGTELNAEAVVLNFERGRNTKHAQRGKPIGDQYAYYGDMWGGFDGDSVITSVTAKDAKTVVFTTKAAFGPFLANMAMPSFAIISPKSIRDDPDGWMTVNSRGAAGTGPFMFRPGAWLRGRSLTLDRNPSYWQKDDRGVQLPYLDKVTFRFIADTSARIAELKAGSLDAIRDFSPQDIATLKADPNLQVISRPSFSVAYIGVNHSERPFDNVNVRRAVAHAINKNAIAQAIFGGAAMPASQFLVPGMLGYDDSVTDFYKYDPEGAKKALADGGMPNGFETELWYMPVSRPYYPDPKKIAEAFAADLAKVGIKATLRTEDQTSYLRDARENRFGLWLLDRTGDSGDPDNFLNVLFGPKVIDGKDTPIEGGAWSNPQAWALLRQARREISESKRAELYKQVSKIIQREVVRIPTFHATPPIGISKKVRGFVPHLTGGEAFTRVVLAK